MSPIPLKLPNPLITLHMMGTELLEDGLTYCSYQSLGSKWTIITDNPDKPGFRSYLLI